MTNSNNRILTRDNRLPGIVLDIQISKEEEHMLKKKMNEQVHSLWNKLLQM